MNDPGAECNAIPRRRKPLFAGAVCAVSFLSARRLADMYVAGEGVAEDGAEAVKWHRRGAEQGHAEAQFNLGIMYTSGEGVPQHFLQAYVWANLAASRMAGAKRETAVAR